RSDQFQSVETRQTEGALHECSRYGRSLTVAALNVETMSQLTVDQAIQLALQHQQASQLAEAEEIFRQILTAFPDQADALHLLGGVYLQARRLDLAEKHVRQAIGVRNEGAFHLTLGMILQDSNRHEEARGVYLALL